MKFEVNSTTDFDSVPRILHVLVSYYKWLLFIVSNELSLRYFGICFNPNECSDWLEMFFCENSVCQNFNIMRYILLDALASIIQYRYDYEICKLLSCISFF